MFIRFNQTKLFSEEYVYLGDAVVNDGNIANFGGLTILLSSYAGSKGHAHSMQLRMLVTTGVQTYSLHSHAIQLLTLLNSSYFLGNHRWIGMTSPHVFSDRSCNS